MGLKRDQRRGRGDLRLTHGIWIKQSMLAGIARFKSHTGFFECSMRIGDRDTVNIEKAASHFGLSLHSRTWT